MAGLSNIIKSTIRSAAKSAKSTARSAVKSAAKSELKKGTSSWAKKAHRQIRHEGAQAELKAMDRNLISSRTNRKGTKFFEGEGQQKFITRRGDVARKIAEDKFLYDRGKQKIINVAKKSAIPTAITVGGIAALSPSERKVDKNFTEILPEDSVEFADQLMNDGHAIYLHYPNFMGHSKNAIKIGNMDLGEMIGDPSLPVGHAATILIDDKGNANYYEYGRYSPNNGHLFGDEQRPTVKGGNWRHFVLPKQQKGENDSVYVARIQNMLPDTKTGAYQAMSIPSVDVQKAQEYIKQQADDPNRKEYGIFNTCATGACNSILPFRNRIINNSSQEDDRRGYSQDAKQWSLIPFSTDSYAKRARKAAEKIYIMNE